MRSRKSEAGRACLAPFVAHAHRLIRRAWIALVLLAVLGCERPADPARQTISREQFVAVNVALRQIPADTAAADSLRAAVLAEHGVTEGELIAFVEARAERPLELSQIWTEIQQRLDAPVERDTVPPAAEDTLSEPAPEDALPEPSGEQIRRAPVSPLRAGMSVT